jgi:dihydrofolate reductase
VNRNTPRHALKGGAADQDAEIMDEAFRDTRAVVMGRRILGESPWGDEPPFHAPVFVVTHEARETLDKQGGTSFTFVTEGIESALAQARAAAGGGDVSVAGGANVVQQCLAAGHLDEVQVHIVPLLIGGGLRLFERLDGDPIELERIRVVDSPAVTHLKFRPAP